MRKEIYCSEMRKVYFSILFFFCSVNCNAGINPYALKGLVDGLLRGMEMGQRAQEAAYQRYLIEREIASIDAEMKEIEEDQIRKENKLIKEENTRKTVQSIVYNIIERQNHFINKASIFVGGDLILAKNINTPVSEIVKWKNGNGLADVWSCKRIEQVTNGQVKAQDINPFFNYKALR